MDISNINYNNTQKLIHNCHLHIDRCYDNYIITSNERNEFYNLINNIITNKSNIFNFVNQIGVYSIIDLIIMLNNYYLSNKIIDWLNDILVVLRCKFKHINPRKLINSDIFYKFKKTKLKYNTVINPVVVYIYNIHPYYNKIKCFGYIINDKLNVHFNHLLTLDVYKYKYRLINGILDKINDIPNNIKNNYLSDMSLYHLIITKPDDYLQNLTEYFKLFEIISSKKVSDILHNIDVNDIFEIFKIIHCLLLFGNETLANAFYNSIKDKKVSYIIYINLSNVLQSKLTSDNRCIEHDILANKHMPIIVKNKIIEKLQEMKIHNNDYFKQSLYVDILSKYPWNDDESNVFIDAHNDNTKQQQIVTRFMNTLNQYIYGQFECKDTFKSLICKWLSNPKAHGNSIGLYGPPGVGKTLIAKTISIALNIPFVQISLGGQNNSEFLQGHSYTYSSSQPGIIVKKIVEAGKTRCVIYFDELDKTCKKNDVNEIFNVLVHLTDPKTNDEFYDRFFQELSFSMKNVIFIFSYNDKNIIDKVLRDRFIELELKPYSTLDKINIANQYIINDIYDSIGHNFGNLFDNDTLRYLIENYTHEPGVRELYKKIETIFLKLNAERIFNNNISFNFTPDLVNLYLNCDQHKIRRSTSFSNKGISNGIYTNSLGEGGVLPIQVNNNFVGSEFVIKETGCIGNFLHDSIQAAFSTAMNLIISDISDNFIQNNPLGLHIHIPENGVNKNGTSAGCAITVAFISKILNKKVKNYTAITGEIDLPGRSYAVDNILYKIQGAKKSQILEMYIPVDNKHEIDKLKIPKSDTFNIIYYSHVIEVLYHVLVEFDPSCFKPSIIEKYLNLIIQ